jgi:hypothetical protein
MAYLDKTPTRAHLRTVETWASLDRGRIVTVTVSVKRFQVASFADAPPISFGITGGKHRAPAEFPTYNRLNPRRKTASQA